MLGTKFSPTPVETSPEAEARVEDEDETEGKDGVEGDVLEWLEQGYAGGKAAPAEEGLMFMAEEEMAEDVEEEERGGWP